MASAVDGTIDSVTAYVGDMVGYPLGEGAAVEGAASDDFRMSPLALTYYTIPRNKRSDPSTASGISGKDVEYIATKPIPSVFLPVTAAGEEERAVGAD